MHIPAALLGALLFATAFALPVPQLAGEGAACNSILSSTDNGVGYGIENVEDGLANHLLAVPHRYRRQLAGEGAACNSLLSSTDNGVGYGIKNAEDGIANTINPGSGSSNSGGTGSTPSPPPGKPGPPRRRQLDKISNGLQDISNSAGTGSSTSSLTQLLDTADGDSTSGAANLGASLGQAEESTLERVGSSVPKRNAQLDKISNGFQDISNALGTGSSTSELTGVLDTVDGESTSGAANLGATVGSTEESTLESIGSAVP